MDIFGTSVTAAQEIYNITMFIRGVVTEVKNYESTASEIQAKLEHEFFFLETFKTLFFDSDDSLLTFSALPTNLSKDVNNILGSLRNSLAQYGLLAMKHGISLITAGDSGRAAPAVPEPAETTAKGREAGFRSRLKANLQNLKRRLEPLDWALFDKDKMTEMLREYSEWTERLRQVMTLILLVGGRIGGAGREDITKSSDGVNLGLSHAAERQNRAVKGPPEAFSSLDGELNLEYDAAQLGPYRSAEYTDSSGFGSTTVIVEEHRFQGQNKNSNVRPLAWLLHGTVTSEEMAGEAPALTARSMFTLECFGFIDKKSGETPLLIYRLPTGHEGGQVMTLHDFIEKSPLSPSLSKGRHQKPALGQRFFLGYALAMTLFSVHGSGWVHKNIWSRGILLFPKSGQDTDVTPHLVGWGIARPQDNTAQQRSGRLNEDATPADLEPNIYRHPERYGLPLTFYENKHDIYALGVVLLEIGLWKTMSARFAGPILVAQKKCSLPPATLKHHHLLELSRGKELKQEMGTEFAKVVQRCLLTDFDVEKDDDKYTVLTSKFRALAVEPLKYGISL